MRERNPIWPYVLILLVAMGLALWNTGAQSLWFDEGWSAWAAGQPTLAAAANADATNPPLYYAVLHVTARLWGDSEFGLRVTSLLIGLLGIGVVARWARMTHGRTSAVLTALVAAFMPLLWWAMREARMYTLLMLLALLAVLALERLRRNPSRMAWALLVLAELAALYTHNTGPVIALWLNGLVALAWLTGGRPLRPRPRHWIASQTLAGLLWLPYFLARFLALPSANSGLAATVELSPAGLFALWQGLWQTPWERVLFGSEPLLPFALMLAVFATVVALRWRAAWWPLASALILTAGVLAGLLILGNEPHSRYLVLAAPFVAAAYGGAVARFRRPALRAALIIPPLALYTVNLVYNVAPEAPFQHDDARAMVQTYADTLGPEDTVLAWSYADRYELAYYWDRLGATAQRVTLPEGAERDAILPLLPRSEDAAINVWYTQRADYRGMLDCLIAGGSAALPEVTTVHGMSSRLYHDIAPQDLDLQAADVVFGTAASPVARLTARGALAERAADRALCLPLELTLLAETPGDLKAAVVVLNEQGDEIGRADAIFATADQRTTSTLAAGDQVEAYPLLRLPVGAPPGEYPVYLRIYDEANEPSGYLPQSGEARGRDHLLGQWTALPGAEWAQGAAGAGIPLIQPITVEDSLALIGHSGLTEGELPILRNGDRAALTLLWQGTGELPGLTLADRDGGWSVAMPAPDGPHDALTRDWRQTIVPPAAESGVAEARLLDGTIIARWTVESLPMQTEVPPLDAAVSAVFPGAGELIGRAGPAEPVMLNEPVQVTLVWRAGDTPVATGYTAFVQLLDAGGRVIAQSDSVPSGGARPTTGWRAGEVIEDEHPLTWNETAVPGEATLIAGLYDAATGARVPLADGGDYATLGTISVRP